jgi:hypothetical protein
MERNRKQNKITQLKQQNEENISTHSPITSVSCLLMCSLTRLKEEPRNKNTDVIYVVKLTSPIDLHKLTT